MCFYILLFLKRIFPVTEYFLHFFVSAHVCVCLGWGGVVCGVVWCGVYVCMCMCVCARVCACLCECE